jgi:hypothetical protein
MVDVSVPLALYDFVPVLISAIGLGLIARLVADAEPTLGLWAWLGVGLVVSGGLARASWKLIVAADGADLRLLHDGLYVLLAPGFLLLGTCVWRIRAGGDPRGVGRGRGVPPWLPTVAVVTVLAIVSVAGQGAGRVVPLLWLAAATVGVAVLTLGCATLSRRQGRPGNGWLFLAYLAITLALNGFARFAVQTEAIQWVEQSLNTLNQVLLLVAARRLAADSRAAAPIRSEASAEAASSGDPLSGR